MNKISSRFTVFHKLVFPVFWFGFLAVFVAIGIFGGALEMPLLFLFFPLLMALIGFILMKKLVWDLADEVYDDGEFLLVRKRSEEDRIALSNIMNVNATTYMNPSRITLKLVTPCKFGTEISFSPITAFTLNPFAKNQVAEDLIVRVYQARSRSLV